VHLHRVASTAPSAPAAVKNEAVPAAVSQAAGAPVVKKVATDAAAYGAVAPAAAPRGTAEPAKPKATAEVGSKTARLKPTAAEPKVAVKLEQGMPPPPTPPTPLPTQGRAPAGPQGAKAISSSTTAMTGCIPSLRTRRSSGTTTPQEWTSPLLGWAGLVGGRAAAGGWGRMS